MPQMQSGGIARSRAFVVGAALIGAALVWWPAHKRYFVYPFLGTPSSMVGLESKAKPTDTERRRLELFSFRGRSNDVAAVTLYFGAGVGAGIGFAGGLGRNWRFAMLGTVVGAALGLTFGIAAGRVGEFVFEQLQEVGAGPTLLKTATFHAAAFALLGFGVGLVYAVFNDTSESVLGRAVGGALGGCVAAILFVPICGIVCPLAKTTFFVPDEPAARLLWFLLNAACISAGAAAGLRFGSDQAVAAK